MNRIKISIKISHLLGIVALLCLHGCGLFPKADPIVEKKALADVVDAVQFAVDHAAKNVVWQATQKESAHWAETCRVATSASSQACFTMIEKADPICKKECANGNCNPVALERCRALITGDSKEAFCAANSGTSTANKAWCDAASSCEKTKIDTSRVCNALERSQLPQLIEANLNLAVEQSNDASGGINILVVSFGGSTSQVSSNSIDMILKPRVRDEDYKMVRLPDDFPKNRSVSQEAQALAKQLTTLITNAVEASVKEYETSPNGATVSARSPLLLSDLEVTFSLVVDNNGSIGIKKAWSGIGVELGGATGMKRSNALTIKYGRK